MDDRLRPWLKEQMAKMPKIDEYVRYVLFEEADDHYRLGWMPSRFDGGLIGTPHGYYSILMVWRCECPMPKLST